jgi:hypothetical protein
MWLGTPWPCYQAEVQLREGEPMRESNAVILEDAADVR